MADEGWEGARAGQHASVVCVIKEDGGAPWVDIEPGDMNPMHLAHCLQQIVDVLVREEQLRQAEATFREQGLLKS